jgi:hypothetical protein
MAQAEALRRSKAVGLPFAIGNDDMELNCRGGERGQVTENAPRVLEWYRLALCSRCKNIVKKSARADFVLSRHCWISENNLSFSIRTLTLIFSMSVQRSTF